MKKFLLNVLFTLCWPLIAIYSPLRVRSRILIIHNNTFLAVKHTFGRSTWGLPGGGVKIGESHKSAAIREAREELGIELNESQVQQLLPVKLYNEGGHLCRYAMYVVDIQQLPAISLNTHELESYAWLAVDAPKLAHHTATAVSSARDQLGLLK